MLGIMDGRNLEKHSVPIDRLEVDIATQVELDAAISNFSGQITDVTTLINNVSDRVTILEGYDNDGFAAHLLAPISTAHSGQIAVEAQIPNVSLGEHKMAFTVLHLGSGATEAAPGNHTHTASEIGDFDPADYVRKTGSIAETVTGTKTFSDNLVVQGNLTVNGSTVTVNAENMAVEDNEITLNSLESGAGVSLGSAGLRIERGTGTDYLIRFDESDDTFRAGFEGSLKQVAFIEDINTSIINADSTDAGEGTFAGYASSEPITMSKDMGAAYDVAITPKMTAPGDISSIGGWYWVRNSNTSFTVYNTGSNSTIKFSWVAHK